LHYTIQRVFRSRAASRTEEKEEFGKGETGQKEKEGKVVEDQQRLNTTKDAK